jgi:hypothetical protein
MAIGLAICEDHWVQLLLVLSYVMPSTTGTEATGLYETEVKRARCLIVLDLDNSVCTPFELYVKNGTIVT